MAFVEECGSEYADVPYHTEVRWLRLGKVLNRCFLLCELIRQFLESKGKDTELIGERFLYELAFLCDIMSSLNALNLLLQGQGRIIPDKHAAVRAFKRKLCLWENKMLKENLAHFPWCQTMKTQLSTVSFPRTEFAEKLCILEVHPVVCRLWYPEV